MDIASFCESVVKEIKGASSEGEIRGILMRSLTNYQTETARHGQYNSLLILNLIVSLRAAYVEMVNDREISSLLLTAIAVLREYQK